MSILRKLLFVPPVLLGAWLVYTALGVQERPDRAEPGERATSVAVIEMRPQTVLPRVRGFGEVTPARVWTLVPQVPGRIAEIHPELTRGGMVGKGDLLVRIAPETYRAAVAEAEARIAEAEAQLSELSVTEETTGASLEIEREALELARRELERQRNLAERGTVSASVVDEQERAVLQQRARVQELDNQLATVPARRAALTGQKRVAEASLEVAELDLDRTGIRAPFAARVASADVEIDQYVGNARAIATLDGIATAEVEAQIPPSQMAGFVRLAADGRFDAAPADFATVAEGLDLTARVRLAASPVSHEWPARVARISDSVDPDTRSVGVIVAVDDPYGAIQPGRRPPLIKGMFAEVELRAPAVGGRMLIPRSAVREGRVMVADTDDRLAFRPVEVLHSTGGIAVLGEGLAPGTRVVVSDPTPAVPGMLLDPRPAEAVAARLAAAARPAADGDGPDGSR